MKDLTTITRERGIGSYEKHLLICKGPDCCSDTEGGKVWDYLKSRLKELGLTGSKGRIYRSKVGCLQICQQGPIVVVYPDGIWYHRVDVEKMERIIQNHLILSTPLEGECFARNPITASKNT